MTLSTLSDYMRRLGGPRVDLGAFLATLTEELDYGNFKATIPQSDRLRHDAYLKCWRAMDEWQGKMRKGSQKMLILVSYRLS